MPALSSISLIGISAANYALNGSAHNIANHSTPGFRRQLVSQSTGANGGVNSQASLATIEGNALADDLIGLLAAKNQFMANLAVFKASNEMTGSLLDIAG